MGDLKNHMVQKSRYVPALGFDGLTRFYDPIVALTTRERTFRGALVAQAAVGSGHDILDLGCGTGTLAVWIKRTEPAARITGLDGDDAVLVRARQKAARAHVSIRFEKGLSADLPYPAQRFDRVFASLFFHHLSPTEKQCTLAEVFRVLRAGGELHIADWGRPTSSLMRLLFLGIQMLDGFENTRQHVAGQLPGLLSSGGFEEVSVRRTLSTVYGTLALYSARKPT